MITYYLTTPLFCKETRGWFENHNIIAVTHTNDRTANLPLDMSYIQLDNIITEANASHSATGWWAAVKEQAPPSQFFKIGRLLCGIHGSPTHDLLCLLMGNNMRVRLS